MLSPVTLLCLIGSEALAEGTTELGTHHALQTDVDLHVDLLTTGEAIAWNGRSTAADGTPTLLDLEVLDASGASVGRLRSGETSAPLGAGTYALVVQGVDADADGELDPVDRWDVTVPGAAEGRVWTKVWDLVTPSFGQSSRFDGSFYALVDGGSPTESSVVELRLEGLVGRYYFVKANEAGIYHFPGLSCPLDAVGADGKTAISVAEFPLYLNPPERATYSALVPELGAVTVGTDTCDAAAPGMFGAEVTFESNVSGRARLVCDLNGDGVDPSSAEDAEVTVPVEVGQNRIGWRGRDRNGDPVPAGTYDCELSVSLGEFHFVAHDIETSYPGLRMFEVTDARAGGERVRRGLSMFWDDHLVQDQEVLMDNGQPGLERTGPAGIPSGDYDEPTVANVNARSWGDWSPRSKGNVALLDTYAAVRKDTAPVRIEVLDAEVDTDGDRLLDVEETCLHDTDPALADTDDDGLDDFAEVILVGSDPRDPDSEDDGRRDGDEASAADPERDTDGDERPDWDDDDDDGDGIPTGTEVEDGDAFGADPDGDGVPNPVDTNSDGDDRDDEEEGRDDDDGDGVPNYLDPIDDAVEETPILGFYRGGCDATGGAPGALGSLVLAALALVRRRR